MTTLHLITIVLIAVSSNLDNLGVGIAYGIRGTCIRFPSNLLIALITAAGTLLSMLVGTTLHRFLTPALASLIGGLTIVAIGAWIMVQSSLRLHKARSLEDELQDPKSVIAQHILFSHVLKFLDDPFFLDQVCATDIKMRETVLLGTALTMNNFVNGVAAGMLGLSISLVTMFVGLFSIIAIWLGRTTGRSHAYRWIGSLTGPVSGLLLMSIGVYEIFF